MISLPPEGFEWPPSWTLITAADPVDLLDSELRKEVSAGHPLFGVTCCAIARRCVADDVLYLTDHSQMPIAVVHLTWRNETSADFPWCKGYLSWEAFRTDWTEGGNV